MYVKIWKELFPIELFQLMKHIIVVISIILCDRKHEMKPNKRVHDN